MKKLIWLSLFLLASILIISGCVKNPERDEQEEPTLTSKPELEGGSMETGDGYGFTILKLVIEENNEEVVHATYDVTKKAEATYVDQFEAIDVAGPEAMDQLFYLFDHMRLTKDTPGEEAVEKILEYYQIENFSHLKLDIDFDEGTTLRIDENG